VRAGLSTTAARSTTCQLGGRNCLHGCKVRPCGHVEFPAPLMHVGVLMRPAGRSGESFCKPCVAAHVAGALDERGDDAAQRQQRLVDQARLLGALVYRARPAADKRGRSAARGSTGAASSAAVRSAAGSAAVGGRDSRRPAATDHVAAHRRECAHLLASASTPAELANPPRTAARVCSQL